MITAKNLAMHELIGLRVEIVSSTNKSHVGIKGVVTDETRQTLTIDTGKGKEKSFAKDQCTFRFRIPAAPDTGSGEPPSGRYVWVRVDGRLLVARPEDRIKKKLKKW